MPFSNILPSGGLLTHQFIEAIQQPSFNHPAVAPETFSLPGQKTPSPAELERAIGTSWELLVERWDGVERDLAGMDISTLRERWIRPLLSLLDFSLEYQRADLVIEDLRFPISHMGLPSGAEQVRVPVHTVLPTSSSLDTRSDGGAGLRRLAPHDLLQRYLNLDRDANWGLLTDGLRLRLLRDYHHTYTRGYVEFDLQGIFSGRDFAAFRALYRLCHASRFLPISAAVPANAAATKRRKVAEEEGEGELAEERQPEAQTPLEVFYQHALSTGVKVGDDLRKNVQAAIETFANGFLQASPGLLARLQSEDNNHSSAAPNRQSEIDIQQFYSDILHTIYRILFLLFAEQRGMFPGRGSLYMEEYSLTALRGLAERPSGEDAHTDLWERLKATFRMVEHGALALGIFGYNGALFSSTKTPILTPIPYSPEDQGIGDKGIGDTPLLRNDSLLKAIRALTTVERVGVLQRISYADLSVEEMGSVYESQLDYTPRIAAVPEKVGDRKISANTFFLDPRGKERKTTGSYYTHPSLVNELIKSALIPVLEDRLESSVPGYDAEHPENLTEDERRRTEETLLSIKVIDPAAGSGAFLIAADNVLGLRLAQIRNGDLYPSEGEIRRARRDVLANCLYAVDLNPMAVELCKVSLWINAVVEEEKLNFLDHHIKCGNSLVGASLRLVAQGVPSGAYGGATGDDRELANAVKKRNDQERAGQLSALRVTELKSLADLRAWAELSRLAQEDPVEAERRFRELQARSEESAERLAFDLWTAAFFWPLEAETDGRSEQERARAGIVARRGERRIPLPPTTQDVFQALATPRLVDEQVNAYTHKLREEHCFFHWELEFPEVFSQESNAGFDVVLGNPPWERLQFEEQDFFMHRKPEISEEPRQKVRWAMVEKLRYDEPNLYNAWLHARRTVEKQYNFLRNSYRFPLSAIDKFNLYAVFAELAGSLYNEKGQAGTIVKAGYLTDKLCSTLFSGHLRQRRLVSAHEFENRKRLFPSVDSRERYVLLTFGNLVNRADFCFDNTLVDDINDDERHIFMSEDDILLFSPNTMNCPKFTNTEQYRIAKKCYSIGTTFIQHEPYLNPWDISIDRYINVSDFSDRIIYRVQLRTETPLFFSNNAEAVPIYEGKLFHQYDHRFASYNDKDERAYEVFNKGPDSIVMCLRYISPDLALRRNPSLSGLKGLLCIRNITNRTNERGSIAAIIPAGITDYSIRAISLPNRPLDSLILLSIFNCFVFDFIAKQRLGGTNFSNYIIEQIPVIHPEKYPQKLRNHLIPLVLELTYTGWDLSDFADDSWHEAKESLSTVILHQWEANAAATGGGHASAERPEWAKPVSSDGFPRPPFKWDEERRAHLRAELDGLYAHLYGLTRDEFAYILDTFPIVRRKDEAKYGEFRTKRLCLEAYDRLVGSDLIPLEARLLQAESVLEKGAADKQTSLSAISSAPKSAVPKSSQPTASSAAQPDLQPKTAAPNQSYAKPVIPTFQNRKAEVDSRKKPVSPSPAQPVKTVKAEKSTPPQAGEQMNFSDYTLYKCEACGKLVIGFDRANHTRDVHKGKEPGYKRRK